MLKKLLKYDLRWVGKIIIVFYSLGLIFSLFALAFANINESFFIQLISKICAGIAMSMVISALFNSVLRSWVRFIQNIYKDESYLTHTLPVEKNTIFLSKFSSAIITCLVSLIVIAVCVLISYYSVDMVNFFKMAITEYYSLIIIALLEIIFMIQVGYLGIVFGYKQNQNKLLKSIISSFVIYIVLSGLSLLLVYIYSLIFHSGNNIFNQANISLANAKDYLYFALGVYVVYNVGLYFACIKLFNTGVDVD